jgi:hypothetical protein
MQGHPTSWYFSTWNQRNVCTLYHCEGTSVNCLELPKVQEGIISAAVSSYAKHSHQASNHYHLTPQRGLLTAASYGPARGLGNLTYKHA